MTREELHSINKKYKELLANRRPEEFKNLKSDKKTVLLCGGTACKSSGADSIYKEFVRLVDESKLNERVQIVNTGCFGFCEKGPIVKVMPENSFYVHVKPEDVKDIVEQHLIGGKEVDRLLYDEIEKNDDGTESIPFYKKQMRIVLRNCGVINPEDINEYIGQDGYLALEKALFDMQPIDIIEEVKKSGLRGRGGAGFPTGLKWEAGFKAMGPEKYVVCNADEGDPGAYMDRSTIEGDPNSILEAMAICGRAIGASAGYIYIRAEYPLAVHRLEVAIAQAKETGLLGKNILGSGFDFDIEIRLGAGAFVCGEETALLRSIEGKRGMPTPKPPFPAQSGLWGKPTVINNVETWANVAQIIYKGADWFSQIGDEDSKGTKVFALTGKINNSGLVEVPMGTTLREIIFDVGGGIKGGKKFKGVQTGGPSGGIICEDELDTPIDFGSLIKLGSMMGSGGMIVMDEDDCMVSVAKFYLEFTVGESCGKCTPCRIGNKRMLEILTRITEGKGEMEDLERLQNLASVIKDSALCGLGQTSPNPVLSTLANFRDEYVEHVRAHKCRAKKCKALLTYTIDPQRCKGCSACAKSCPAQAIMGESRKPHVINPYVCIRCGMCTSRCHFGAISVI